MAYFSFFLSFLFLFSLKPLGSLLCLYFLEFHNAMPSCGAFFFHCGKYSVGPFNLATHIFQFWGVSFLSNFIDHLSLFAFSLISFKIIHYSDWSSKFLAFSLLSFYLCLYSNWGKFPPSSSSSAFVAIFHFWLHIFNF